MFLLLETPLLVSQEDVSIFPCFGDAVTFVSFVSFFLTDDRLSVHPPAVLPVVDSLIPSDLVLLSDLGEEDYTAAKPGN